MPSGRHPALDDAEVTAQHAGIRKSLDAVDMVCRSSPACAPPRVGSRQASRRRRKRAARQGERFCFGFERKLSVHPEEVPSFGTISKGGPRIYRPALHGGRYRSRRIAAIRPGSSHIQTADDECALASIAHPLLPPPPELLLDAADVRVGRGAGVLVGGGTGVGVPGPTVSVGVAGGVGVGVSGPTVNVGNGTASRVTFRKTVRVWPALFTTNASGN